MTDQQPDYSKCWANCLGDCDGGMSQEHIVSECLFEGDINVMGLPWCKDEHKTMRIETLTDNILCRRHNTALSDVDRAAKHTMNTLKAALDLHERRNGIHTRTWTIQYFESDMLLLERWALKTLINIRMSSKPDYPVEGDWNQLVRIVFGLEKFTPPKWLYMMALVNYNMTLGDGRITITTQTVNDKLGGAKFELWGLPFFLSLIEDTLQLNHGKGRMLRGGFDQWFNTRDRKSRPVKSHLLTYIYPKETTDTNERA